MVFGKPDSVFEADLDDSVFEVVHDAAVAARQEKGKILFAAFYQIGCRQTARFLIVEPDSLPDEFPMIVFDKAERDGEFFQGA